MTWVLYVTFQAFALRVPMAISATSYRHCVKQAEYVRAIKEVQTTSCVRVSDALTTDTTYAIH